MSIFTKQDPSLILEILKSQPGMFSVPKVGDLVQGTVLEKGSRRMLVDLGKLGTGVVYRSELQNAREAVRDLKPGDPTSGKVVIIDNEEDLIELSLTAADKQKAWAEVAELRDKEEVVVIKPTKFNRGGLVAEVAGLPAFLPVSQLHGDHYPKATPDDSAKIAEGLQALIGLEISVRVIDVNSRTNKLIVSERAANELSAKELAKNYSVGQIIDGIVSGVADFGAFVKFTDNPAVEGLIHVSELDWREVLNPKEIIKIDDAIKAKIVDIKDGKISLSLKALQDNPWEKAGERYKADEAVSGRVYSFNPFGAVISLEHGLQGQIRVTEFGGVEEMKKHLVVGNEYEFTVQSVEPAERRIVLRIKK